MKYYKTTFSIKAHFLIWSYEACNNKDKLVIENLVLGPKCIGPKLYRAEVFPGQSIIRAEVFLGPKCALGQSMLGAKVSVGPKWSWSQTGCETKYRVQKDRGIGFQNFRSIAMDRCLVVQCISMQK